MKGENAVLEEVLLRKDRVMEDPGYGGTWEGLMKRTGREAEEVTWLRPRPPDKRPHDADHFQTPKGPSPAPHTAPKGFICTALGPSSTICTHPKFPRSRPWAGSTRTHWLCCSSQSDLLQPFQRELSPASDFSFCLVLYQIS